MAMRRSRARARGSWRGLPEPGGAGTADGRGWRWSAGQGPRSGCRGRSLAAHEPLVPGGNAEVEHTGGALQPELHGARSGNQACSQVMPASSRRASAAGPSGSVSESVRPPDGEARTGSGPAGRAPRARRPPPTHRRGTARGCPSGGRRRPRRPGSSTEILQPVEGLDHRKAHSPRPVVPVRGEGERVEPLRGAHRSPVGQEAAPEVGLGRAREPFVGQHPDPRGCRGGRRPCGRGSHHRQIRRKEEAGTLGPPRMESTTSPGARARPRAAATAR